MFFRALVLSAGDDAAGARAEYVRAASVCHRFGDRLGEARAWHRAAGFYWLPGEWESAAVFRGRAARAFAAAGDRRRAGREYADGALAVYLEVPAAALEMVEQAAELSPSAQTLVTAGFVCQALGRYGDALGYYLTSERGSRTEDAASERLNGYLGALAAVRGDTWVESRCAAAGWDRHETYELLVRARRADSAVRAEDSIPKPLRGAESDSYDAMLASYRRAIDSFARAHDTANWELQLWMAGRCYVDAGMPEYGAVVIRKALELSETKVEDWERTAIVRDLAEAYRSARNVDSTLSVYLRLEHRNDDEARWGLHLLYRRHGEESLRQAGARLGLDPEDVEKLLRCCRVANKPRRG
jgi:tetratricopeptide (TPR) repeat protein